MQFFRADHHASVGTRRKQERFPDDPFAVLPIVPSVQRAMNWQSTSPTNTPVVRERYWIEFQSGEMRDCDGCHGANATNQAGQTAPSNTPQTLIALLNR